nr:helicase-associated domain-containing protein [Corynebacterium lactis]
MTSSTPFASFSEWLSAQATGFLGDILALRPDAVSPPPKSTQVLAARLQLRASVARALTKLPLLPLACIEAAAELDADIEPISADRLIEAIDSALEDADFPRHLRPTPTHVREALDHLRELGLIWGNGAGPKGRFAGKSTRKNPLEWQDYFRVVDEAAASMPPGWQLIPRADRPAVADLRAELGNVSGKQQRLLDTLAEAGGLGSSKDAAPGADPDLPVPNLIARGLLERVDNSTVRLPATVRALMRGARIPEGPLPLRPAEPETVVISGGSDRASATAWETLRRVTELLTHLGEHPAATLKDGAIGVRETRALCETLGLDISELAQTVAFASAAGFVHVGTPHPLPSNDNGGDYFAPTIEADAYLESGIVDRWVSLVMGNRGADYAPWRVDEINEEGKRIALLSRQARLSSVPEVCEMVLRCCAVDGSATPSDTDVLAVADLRAVAAQRFPITNSRTSDAVLFGVVEQLCALGLTVQEGHHAEGLSVGLSAAGRALIDVVSAQPHTNSVAHLHTVFSGLLPPDASYFLVQADNTIVVPGPASAEMEKMLSAIATVESPGLASVYRITENSLSNALDSGVSATEIMDFLGRFALGEVPQSIQYLLDDVARRHGKLRGGPAASFVRSDDPALIAALLSGPVAEKLGLRMIADTVLISQAPLGRVIEATREAGLSIIAEDAAGLVLDLTRQPSRIQAPAPDIAKHSTGVDGERINKALESMRAGDRAEAGLSSASGGGVSVGDDPNSATAAYNLLKRASRTGQDVTLGFVDRNGQAGRRRVRPVTVSGGQVDAIDPSTGQVLRFLLHRITEVHLAE